MFPGLVFGFHTFLSFREGKVHVNSCCCSAPGSARGTSSRESRAKPSMAFAQLFADSRAQRQPWWAQGSYSADSFVPGDCSTLASKCETSQLSKPPRGLVSNASCSQTCPEKHPIDLLLWEIWNTITGKKYEYILLTDKQLRGKQTIPTVLWA